MNEALRNFAVLLWAVCAINSNSYAGSDKPIIQEENLPETPTVIMGEAASPSGQINQVVVEQPANAPNPLGNPIVGDGDSNNPPAQANPAPTIDVSRQNLVPIASQSAPSGVLQPGEVALPQPANQPSNQIENEMYQSGDDIIDVQAFPMKDVNEAETPNLQPTIVAN